MSTEDENNKPSSGSTSTTTSSTTAEDNTTTTIAETNKVASEDASKTNNDNDDEVSQPTAVVAAAPAANGGGGDDEEDNEDVNKQEESTATFEPVIQLEEVEVKSGEEEEETVCSYRSKLFVYGETLLDRGTGNKTWKERGIGEARILRHRGHQRLRFLMRQEKTMKVIANHVLDPRIQLEPNAGSDRSWVWSCFDYADGELVERVFALRFANSEVADEFKTTFQKCQDEMARLLAGQDAPKTEGGEGGGETEEVAKALDGLTTKEESED